jgi:hypothetical protein
MDENTKTATKQTNSPGVGEQLGDYLETVSQCQAKQSNTPGVGEKTEKEPEGNGSSNNLAKEDKSAQAGTSEFAVPPMSPDKVKLEYDLFRDALSNVNQTLRFQISLAVPLMAACVTMLNIVPPQSHQELLNEFDRWVFLPALISIGMGYHGLERHWYLHRKKNQLVGDVDELYDLVQYKNRMVHIVLVLQAVALILMMTFVLLEYK